MPKPIFVRPLTQEEHRQVEALVRCSDAVTYRHARVVLLSSQGRRVTEVVAATGLTERWVRALIHRFNEGGLAALPRKKAPGAVQRCGPQARAALIALLHRSPTEFGIESELWTAPDLAAIAQQLELIPKVSARTVQREVRRAGHSWQQAKRWSGKEPQYVKKEKGQASDRASPSRSGVGAGV